MEKGGSFTAFYIYRTTILNYKTITSFNFYFVIMHVGFKR